MAALQIFQRRMGNVRNDTTIGNVFEIVSPFEDVLLKKPLDRILVEANVAYVVETSRGDVKVLMVADGTGMEVTVDWMELCTYRTVCAPKRPIVSILARFFDDVAKAAAMPLQMLAEPTWTGVRGYVRVETETSRLILTDKGMQTWNAES
jgi:hypothetical protein